MTPVMRAEDGTSSVVCEGTGPAWLAAHPGIVHDLDALPGKLLVRVLRDVAVEGAQDVVPRLDQLDVDQVLQGNGLLLSEQHCIWRKCSWQVHQSAIAPDDCMWQGIRETASVKPPRPVGSGGGQRRPLHLEAGEQLQQVVHNQVVHLRCRLHACRTTAHLSTVVSSLSTQTKELRLLCNALHARKLASSVSKSWA